MMRTYKKYSYTLTTKSYLALSPRASMAFYREIHFDKNITFGEEKRLYNTIYPFYQYGDYSMYDPGSADYYIPGSAIKGALCSGENSIKDESLKLMVDDIILTDRENENDSETKTEVISLSKTQYFHDLLSTPKYKQDKSKIPKIADFFAETVGIEVIKKDIILKGSFLYDGDDIEEFLKRVYERTSIKRKNYILQMDNLLKKLKEISTAKPKPVTNFANIHVAENLSDLKKINEGIKNTMCHLKTIKNAFEGINMDKCIFLGGYKGLLRSLETTATDKIAAEKLMDQSAIFVDTEELPLGIVEFCLDESENSKKKVL